MPRYLLQTRLPVGKFAEYVQRHDQIYPEVAQGLRQAGVEQLTIWTTPPQDNKNSVHLMMYALTKPGVDLGDATGPNSIYRNSHPRIKEWEEMMEGTFHSGWQELQEIHSSDTHWP